MNGDENRIHEAQHPNFRELERRRLRLLKERDLDGLVALAGEVEAAPPGKQRDRLLYTVHQNANWTARASRDDRDRGLAIGATIFAVLVAGSIAAAAAFGDYDSTYNYRLRNDTGEARLVRLCDDETCRFPADAVRLDPGDRYDATLESRGRYLVADAGGRTLGCIDAVDFIVTITYDLSELDDCPESAPKHSG